MPLDGPLNQGQLCLGIAKGRNEIYLNARLARELLKSFVREFSNRIVTEPDNTQHNSCTRFWLCPESVTGRQQNCGKQPKKKA
jgi:hypothetical protein